MSDVPQQQTRTIERRIAMGQPLTGYGWPGMKVRWCTGQLKTHLISKEVNRLKLVTPTSCKIWLSATFT